MVALDAETGKEVWREPAGLSSTWSTPILMNAEGAVELVIAVSGEIWGLNPETGRLKWFAEGFTARSMCVSLAAGDGVVYCAGGNPSGTSFAVRTGGKDDVTESHVVWTGPGFARISTPVLHDGHLYGASGGVAYCVNAETGERVYRTRLGTGEAVMQEQRRPGGGGFGGQRQGRPDGGQLRAGRRGAPSGERARGGRARMGGEDYGSAVLADGKVYILTTAGVTYVVDAKPEFKLLAKNRFESDESGFNSTPAISDGQLFIRSNKNLYCVSDAHS
jgi:outer membrane protein assembly factor BamB